jgi:hypothetical protein
VVLWTIFERKGEEVTGDLSKIHDLYLLTNTLTVNKSKRIAWQAHVARTRDAKRIHSFSRKI